MPEPSNSPKMDSFLRKQKPRASTTTPLPPTSITAAPRAIVRPSTAVRLEDSHHTSTPTTPPQPSTAAPDTPTSAPKPRKRFRKKVSGLFDDQSDLKKRMSKFLIDIKTNDIVLGPNKFDDTTRQPSTPETPSGLPRADGIVARLEATLPDKQDAASLDEFDTPEFVATASRALGSPEKLQTVRKTMGRLSPRSNERFLAELQLGTPPPRRRENGEKHPITPPELPSVDSSELDSEREGIASPVSVERTGAPAVLRRKARRLDRGYRSADVLRQRLGELPRRAKRGRGLEFDLGEIRAKARKTATRDHSQVADQGEVETDTEDEIGSLEIRTPRRTEEPLMASDPFQMLVEVAAVERKSSVPSGETEELDRTSSKRKSDGERRRKKRRRGKDDVVRP